MSAIGPKLTFLFALHMSASLIGRFGSSAFGMSHHFNVDVAHGLVLLFGIGIRALPSWGSRTRRNNLSVGLVIRVMAGPSRHAISPHSSSRKGHHATARWSQYLLSSVILRCHAAVAACRLQRNSVPSSQIRCMTTANRRASATIAFFTPRRLAICIAQAFNQDTCV